MSRTENEVTICHKTSQENQQPILSERQFLAIPLILAGKSDQAVADELEVSRETIWRWRNEDFNFVAALNVERNQIFDSARDRLEGLVTKALDCVEKAIDTGDTRAALAILKMVDLSEEREFETNPEQLEFEILHEQARKDYTKKRRVEFADGDQLFGIFCDTDQKIYLEACKRLMDMRKDKNKNAEK